MNYYRLFLFTIKQYLKKPLFLTILLLIPLLTMMLSNSSNPEKSPSIQIGFYTSGNSTELHTLSEHLTNNDSLFTFISYSSEAALRNDVAKGFLECGYIIPDNLFDQLLDNKKKELVRVITSPKTTMAPMINETFYAAVFEQLSGLLLTRYLTEQSSIASYCPDYFDRDDITHRYHYYLSNGSTFSFQYLGAPTEYQLTTKDILLSPIRGILSILILLCAFCGALAYYNQQNNPLYQKPLIRLVNITIPTLFATMFSLVSILFSEIHQGIVKECLAILLYSIACIIFLFVLSTLIKNRELFSSILPVFLLACMIFSPIFLDVTTLVPSLKPVSYLFLPTYYLKLF